MAYFDIKLLPDLHQDQDHDHYQLTQISAVDVTASEAVIKSTTKLKSFGLEPVASSMLAFEHFRHQHIQQLLMKIQGNALKLSKAAVLSPYLKKRHDILSSLKDDTAFGIIDSVLELSKEQKKRLREEITINNFDASAGNRQSPRSKHASWQPSGLLRIFQPWDLMTKLPGAAHPFLSLVYVVGPGNAKPYDTFALLNLFFILKGLTGKSKRAAWHAIAEIQGFKRSPEALTSHMTSPKDWGFYFWLFAEEMRAITRSSDWEKNHEMLAKSNPMTIKFISKTVEHLDELIEGTKNLPAKKRQAVGGHIIYQDNPLKPNQYCSPQDVPIHWDAAVKKLFESGKYLK